MPGMLESWDSQYNILGSSLQNQIVGSLHLDNGLSGCSLGASSNANSKIPLLHSATTKLGPDTAAVFGDPLSHGRLDTTCSSRQDRLHERCLSHESSDEFRPGASSAAAFLLDEQWDSKTHAGMWGPKRAKTQYEPLKTNPVSTNLFSVTGYMNFEPLKEVAVNDAKAYASETSWSVAGFGPELQIPENHPLNRKRQTEDNFTSLNGKNEESILFRNGFSHLAPGFCDEDQQQLTAREAYEEFQHDDIMSSNKRLLKRSSKGGPRRPNIIKGQWTPEEDRYYSPLEDEEMTYSIDHIRII